MNGFACQFKVMYEERLEFTSEAESPQCLFSIPSSFAASKKSLKTPIYPSNKTKSKGNNFKNLMLAILTANIASDSEESEEENDVEKLSEHHRNSESKQKQRVSSYSPHTGERERGQLSSSSKEGKVANYCDDNIRGDVVRVEDCHYFNKKKKADIERMRNFVGHLLWQFSAVEWDCLQTSWTPILTRILQTECITLFMQDFVCINSLCQHDEVLARIRFTRTSHLSVKAIKQFLMGYLTAPPELLLLSKLWINAELCLLQPNDKS